jgi:hypothetical protein
MRRLRVVMEHGYAYIVTKREHVLCVSNGIASAHTRACYVCTMETGGFFDEKICIYSRLHSPHEKVLCY